MSFAFDFDQNGHLQPILPSADVLHLPRPSSRTGRPSAADVRLDPARDALLTPFGRATYAIGANETAARFSGIRVGATKLWIYTAAGFCAANCRISVPMLAGESVTPRPNR